MYIVNFKIYHVCVNFLVFNFESFFACISRMLHRILTNIIIVLYVTILHGNSKHRK